MEDATSTNTTEQGFSEEEYEAAFNAQVNGTAPSGESHESHGEVAEEDIQEQDEQREPDAGDESSAEDGQPVLAGLTEKQLKEVLAKAQELDAIKASFGNETQKIYGKFGELQREIKSLRGGSKLGVNKEMFKRLADLDPELADALASDLSGVEVNGNGFDEDKFSAAVDARVKQAERAFEMKILSLKHRDWQAKIASADYALWLGTLPDDERVKVRSTTDGIEAAEYLDTFEEWRQRGARKQEKEQQKQDRLKRAVQPLGASGNTTVRKVMDDEDAFQAGVKAAFRDRGIIKGRTK